MRKLIYGINLTLDGCCDHAKGIADAELHDFYAKVLRQADTLVYGRKTYQLMVPYWPEIAKNNSGETQATKDFAQAFDSVKKIVVFSRSLSSVEDKKTTIANGDLREEILKLKQQEGKDISLGGVDIPTQLMQLGLIDEYCFVIQPLLVGDGRRLLSDGLILHQKLQLIESKVFKSGSVMLRYAKGSS